MQTTRTICFSAMLLFRAHFCLGQASNSVGPGQDQAEIPAQEQEEFSLGQQTDSFWENNKPFLLQDNPTVRRVDAVVQSLVPATDRTNLIYRTAVINDPGDINAYSVPGGFVYVTTGLLELLDSTDELALVVAHELGHLSGRHGMKALRDAKTADACLQIVRIMAMAGAQVASSRIQQEAQTLNPKYSFPGLQQPSAQLGQLAGLAVQRVAGVAAFALATTAITGYGRQRENEADELGLIFVKRQGHYDPAAAINLFRLFDSLEEQAANPPKEPGLLSYQVTSLRSHPRPGERQKNAEEWLAQNSVNAKVASQRRSKLPAMCQKPQGPETIGPEVFPVEFNEVWFSACRIAITDYRVNRLVAADRAKGEITLSSQTGSGESCVLNIRLAPADPAGTEIAVTCISTNRAWWPTIFWKQIKADLGLTDFKCLAQVSAEGLVGPSNLFHVPGQQDAVLRALREKIPWRLLSANAPAGYLHFAAVEGKNDVMVKLLVSPETDGACKVYVSQGAMVTTGKPAVDWISRLLKQEARFTSAHQPSLPP